MTAASDLRYIDSDGHILEHPTDMPQYAPAKYRERIWHIETDDQGVEWLHYDGNVTPANGLASGPRDKISQPSPQTYQLSCRYPELVAGRFSGADAIDAHLSSLD